MGGQGSVCDYGGAAAQVLIFHGPAAEQTFRHLLRAYKREDEKRYQVPGLSDDAYAIFPKPKTKHESPFAVLVVRSGQYLAAVTMDAEQPATAPETLLPKLVAAMQGVIKRPPPTRI